MAHNFLDADISVYVLLHLPPWKVAMQLEGTVLTSKGLAAFLNKKKESNNLIPTNDLLEILAPNQSFYLQIEHKQMPIAEPYVQAKLLERHETHIGYELAFKFIEPVNDLEINR